MPVPSLPFSRGNSTDAACPLRLEIDSFEVVEAVSTADAGDQA